MANVPRLRTKNDIPEFVRGRPRSSPDSPGSGPSRAGQDLGSTRAGGKDDGSLHKLHQIMISYYSYFASIVFLLLVL